MKEKGMDVVYGLCWACGTPSWLFWAYLFHIVFYKSPFFVDRDGVWKSKNEKSKGKEKDKSPFTNKTLVI